MIKAEFNIILNDASDFDSRLQDAAQQLGLDLNTEQRRQLLMYLDKLLFWNKAYNLTAIKQPIDALIKHIFDCLAIIPHLKAGRLLDIGTGAGLPGVIIGICQPDRLVTVLDSNQKKIRFIKQSISELNVGNVTPIASRIENYNLEDSEKFAVVTSRAFASLTDFVTAAAPRMADDGCLQAMKGLVPDEQEVLALNESWKITVTALDVPSLHNTRHLIDLQYRDR